MKIKISFFFFLAIMLNCAPQKKAPPTPPTKLTKHLMNLNEPIQDKYDEVRCCPFKLEDLKEFFFDRKEIEANELMIAKIITSLKKYNNGSVKFEKRTQPCISAKWNLEALLGSVDYEQMSDEKRFEELIKNNDYLLLGVIINDLDLNFIKSTFQKSNLETKQLLLTAITKSTPKEQREVFFTESFINQQDSIIKRRMEFVIENSKKKGYNKHYNPCYKK